ncbi:hypothetical protein R1sor_020767 [Riccia sorocarpa]|uniref:Uncharacterized protein n=1 Tax=Riccia sorocarpa TaxID=122646 RepID=A0ABD3GGK8_9MARC
MSQFTSSLALPRFSLLEVKPFCFSAAEVCEISASCLVCSAIGSFIDRVVGCRFWAVCRNLLAAAMASHVDYAKLSRKELQALCKQHKIPANKTNVFMAEALDALLNNAPRQQEEFPEEEPPAPDSPEVEAKVEKVKGKQTRRKAFLPDPELYSLTDMLAQSSLEPTVDEEAPDESAMQEKTFEDPQSVDNFFSPAPVVAAAPKGRRGRPRKVVNAVVDAPMAEASEPEGNSRTDDVQLPLEEPEPEPEPELKLLHLEERFDESAVPVQPIEEPRAIHKTAKEAPKPRRGRKKAEKASEEIPSLSPPASHVLGSFVANNSRAEVEPLPTGEITVDVSEVEAGPEESMEGVESELWSRTVDVEKDFEQSNAPLNSETVVSDGEIPLHAVEKSEAIRDGFQTGSDVDEAEAIVPVPVEKKKKGKQPKKAATKSRRNMKDEAEPETEAPEEVVSEVVDFEEEREKESLPSPAEKIEISRKGRKGLKSRRGVEAEQAVHVMEELEDEVVTSVEVIDAVAVVDEEMEKEYLPSPVEKSKKGRKGKKVVKPRRYVEVEAEQDLEGGEVVNDEALLPGESCVTEVDSTTEGPEEVVQKENFSWTVPPSILEEEKPVPPKKSLPPAFTISPYVKEKKPRRKAKGLKKTTNSEEPMEDVCPEQEVEQTEVQEPVTPVKDNGATLDGDDKENLKDDLVHLSMRKLFKKCKEKGLKAQGTNTTRTIKL